MTELTKPKIIPIENRPQKSKLFLKCVVLPMRNAYFKKFSTYPERSFYFFHLIEYKDYPLKLRVARGSGLPEEWDDLPSSVYKVAKSWKHNSKRKHQYFKEDVA